MRVRGLPDGLDMEGYMLTIFADLRKKINGHGVSA